MTVIYRTTGAWGAGKGSPLEKEEVDENFWDHDGRLTELENYPVQPTSIANITVSGSQMSVVLTDATVLGPYTIPRVPFQPSRVETISTATYTLILDDDNAYKRCTNVAGCVVTIPANADVAFAVDTEITFRQCDDVAVSFDTPTDVTLTPLDGFGNLTAGRGAVVTIKKIATNEWDIFGFLAEV